MFNVKKNFKQDLDAAITLGISDDAYYNTVDISNRELSAIEQDVFIPYYPSMNVRRAFQENADAIGLPNPLDNAIDAINEIQNELTSLPLNAAEFPNIENPLVPMNLGTTLPNIGAETPNAPPVNANVAANQGGNVPYNQMTDVQKRAYSDQLFGKG